MQSHETPMVDQLADYEETFDTLYKRCDNGPEDPFSTDEDQEEARSELDNMAYSLDVRHTLEVLLGGGGPTVWLSAEMEQGEFGGVRTGPVSFHHSWAVPQVRELSNASPLVQFFDEQAELVEWVR